MPNQSALTKNLTIRVPIQYLIEMSDEANYKKCYRSDIAMLRLQTHDRIKSIAEEKGISIEELISLLKNGNKSDETNAQVTELKELLETSERGADDLLKKHVDSINSLHKKISDSEKDALKNREAQEKRIKLLERLLSRKDEEIKHLKESERDALDALTINSETLSQAEEKLETLRFSTTVNGYSIGKNYELSGSRGLWKLYSVKDQENGAMFYFRSQSDPSKTRRVSAKKIKSNV